MSRQTHTPLNVSSKPLQPRVIDRHKVDTEISEKQSQQRTFYNRTAKPMYCLNPSDYVWIQLEPADKTLGKSQPWVRGTVKERISNRSYLICLSDGTILMRNRRMLRPAVSPDESSLSSLPPHAESSPLCSKVAPRKDDSKKSSEKEIYTRQGRIRKHPKHLEDFEVEYL